MVALHNSPGNLRYFLPGDCRFRMLVVLQMEIDMKGNKRLKQ